ncbi:hypothetical protein [Hamadaea tsunoensis]|uniref:hypothetical protein n=1 Tax=Hamadaea tsunoensis TaxID=53368 RepID=UPI001FDF7995|nr:hypothetical protein [Hamadaea tsunoensis]
MPAFTTWDTFPFEGTFNVKTLDPPVADEPARKGEEIAECKACQASDDSYIWVNERWRVRAMDRPTGLPMVLILEPRSHLDIGDLSNLLAAELGVLTVRVERAIRSLDEVARVHVNRWGDGAAHLHLWFMGRPKGQLQLRGSFLPMWDDILPPVPESQWRENLAHIAAWLEAFGGTAHAQPPKIEWQAPSRFLGESELSPEPVIGRASVPSASVLESGAGLDADAGSNAHAGPSTTAGPETTRHSTGIVPSAGVAPNAAAGTATEEPTAATSPVAAPSPATPIVAAHIEPTKLEPATGTPNVS